jgi:hypothetical protein
LLSQPAILIVQEVSLLKSEVEKETFCNAVLGRLYVPIGKLFTKIVVADGPLSIT